MTARSKWLEVYCRHLRCISGDPRKSGMYGLFAAGICTASDIEPPYREAKYYDALVEVEHDAVAPAAQGAQQIIEVHPELRDLVERLDSSSMLQLFKIETAQAEALSSVLNRAVLE